jgi:hypothetical protein
VNIQLQQRCAEFNAFAKARQRVLGRVAHGSAVPDDVRMSNRHSQLDRHGSLLSDPGSRRRSYR